LERYAEVAWRCWHRHQSILLEINREDPDESFPLAKGYEWAVGMKLRSIKVMSNEQKLVWEFSRNIERPRQGRETEP